MWCDVVGWGGISDAQVSPYGWVPSLGFVSGWRQVSNSPHLHWYFFSPNASNIWNINIQISSLFLSDSGLVVKSPPPDHSGLGRCPTGSPRSLWNIKMECLIKFVPLPPSDEEGFEPMSFQVVCIKSKSVENFYHISKKLTKSSVSVAKW